MRIAEELGAAAAHVLPFCVRVRGPLDVERLRSALDALLGRHEVLRSRFPLVDGRGVQVVASDAQGSLDVVDLRGAADAEDRARELVLNAARPFVLADELPLRAQVIRLDAQEHLVTVVVHHIAADGQSTRQLLRELGSLYDQGPDAQLPTPTIQYADYAAWELGHGGVDALEPRLAWWRAHLRDARSALPTDRPRRPGVGFRGAQADLQLPEAPCRDLTAFARQHRATPFVTLLSAGALLVRHLQERDDVVLGVSMSERGHPDLTGVVGHFVNQLPVRLRVDGAPTVAALLADVRESLVKATKHRAPFDAIIGAVRPQPEPQAAPVVSPIVVFQDYPMQQLELAGLICERVEVELAGAPFELSLRLWRAVDGVVRGYLRYQSDLFSSSTMRRWADCYALAVSSLVESADTPIPALLARLDAHDRQQREAAKVERHQRSAARLDRLRGKSVT